MDCGDFMAYVYKTTLGFDLVNPQNGDPWHITDFRDDANKGENSKYFEYVYKNVSIASIDESKLMPGDLIFTCDSSCANGRHRGITHVVIYVGNGQVVEAKGRAYGVVYGPLRISSNKYYVACRVL